LRDWGARGLDVALAAAAEDAGEHAGGDEEEDEGERDGEADEHDEADREMTACFVRKLVFNLDLRRISRKNLRPDLKKFSGLETNILDIVPGASSAVLVKMSGRKVVPL
jgi:hypothetical protein